MATFRTSQPGSEADPSVPHLILVGLPGSGKSTVGSALARTLGRSFLDFDAEIVRREGMTIAEIFAQRGEPSFREMEHALTEELRTVGGMVLSPGGGWVGRPETVSLIRPPARMIYLRVRPRTALTRMGRSVGTRPLLGRPNPLGELERLLGERRAAYESSEYVVDVERVPIGEVVRRIVAALQP
ncbi:MAG TPA: shikimate kinase [Gemmatimonadaceae bacterium]|jgi:shikimate kinase|nr:shikimate kinase [Gemmatimonadaceae bacterium]